LCCIIDGGNNEKNEARRRRTGRFAESVGRGLRQQWELRCIMVECIRQIEKKETIVVRVGKNSRTKQQRRTMRESEGKRTMPSMYPAEEYCQHGKTQKKI